MRFLILILTVFSFVSGICQARPLEVAAPSGYEEGTLVIKTKERALYLILDEGKALRYPVAVPKNGKQWFGKAHIQSMHDHPAWAPPADVRKDHPELPNYIPGGDPTNPMGSAALLLDRSEIAIHGTAAKMRNSIGTAASYGCIRMYNEDIEDLYQRVDEGALVVMLK